MASSFAELAVLINPAGAVAGAKVSNRAMDSMAVKARQTSTIMGGSFSRLGAAVGATAGVIVGALGAIAFIKAAGAVATFEKNLVGVGKTTNLAGQALDRIGQAAIGMSKTIPVGANELLNLTQIAGQLGIRGESDLLKFTATIAKLGTAGNISGEEAAIGLARMLAVTGQAASEVDVLASVIVRMGNNFAATEAEIVQMAIGVAGAGAQFGLTAEGAVQLSTAMRALGVQSELGRSTILRFGQEAQNAVRAGGPALATFAELTGQSIEDFKNKVKEGDIQELLVRFSVGLNKIQAAGIDVTPVLKSIGIEGIRLLSVLPRMGAGADVVVNSFLQFQDELENTRALTEEYSRILPLLKTNLTLVGNGFDALFIAIGQNFKPELNALVKDFGGFINMLASFAAGDAISVGDFFKDSSLFIKGLVLLLNEMINVLSNAMFALESLFTFASAGFRQLLPEFLGGSGEDLNEALDKILKEGQERFAEQQKQRAALLAGLQGKTPGKDIAEGDRFGPLIGLSPDQIAILRDQAKVDAFIADQLDPTKTKERFKGSGVDEGAQKAASSLATRLVKKTETPEEKFERQEDILKFLPATSAAEMDLKVAAMENNFAEYEAALKKATDKTDKVAAKEAAKLKETADDLIESLIPLKAFEARQAELKVLLDKKLIDDEVHRLATLDAQAEFANAQKAAAEQEQQNMRDIFADTFTGDIAQAWRNLGDDITDVIHEFTKTGKLDFKDMVDSFIDDLQRMIIERTITKPLMDFGESLLFGGASGQGILGGIFGGANVPGNVTPGSVEPTSGTSFIESFATSVIGGYFRGGAAGAFSGAGQSISQEQARSNVSSGSFFDFEGGENVDAFGGTGQGNFSSNNFQFEGFNKHGGAFSVGGVGGSDSQLVAFAATPGELVSIVPSRAGSAHDTTKPGGGRSVIVQNTFNIEGQVNKQSQQRIALGVGGTVARTMQRDN